MPARSAAFERFMASTDIDFDRWHDGIPYDLEALARLEGDERVEIERWLLARADQDWRDLEGLLALGTERARTAVLEQLRNGTLEMRLAAARRLPPDPMVEAEREAAIINGLETATLLTGMSSAIDLARDHPSAAVKDALFRSILRPDRETAVHAAALLAFLHGNAKEPFDWDRRDFYLQFNDDDPQVRAAAFRSLCRECDVDSEQYLGGRRPD
jgi:hypothetical protein